MGIFDKISNFLENREGDFVKLEESEKEYGPGPLLLLYNVPSGIDDTEIQDILSDGAPVAYRKQCRVYRFSGDDNKLLDLPLGEGLETILRASGPTTSQMETAAATITSGVPVLFFSGFQNDEMMAIYNILGQEIYEESGGQASPACAKAVANAMGKPLRQVLEEISGDHKDAMGSKND